MRVPTRAGRRTRRTGRRGGHPKRSPHATPSALRADFVSGDLHVALCVEYDALPGLGHACGHNIIAAAGVGAALALAAVADDAGLHVTVLGTPAEETRRRKGPHAATRRLGPVSYTH